MNGSASVVLVSGADLSEGAPGGSRSYVLGLARALAKDGLRPTILANGGTDAQLDGAHVVPVNDRYRRSSARFFWDLFRWCRTHRLEPGTIVHAQRPDELVPVLLTQKGVRAVCTLHGDAHRGVRRRRGRLASWAVGVLERYALRRAGAVIAVDSRTGEAYRRRLPELTRTLTVIPVAIDRDVFRPSDRAEARRALGLGSELVVLYVGRLSQEKRVANLLIAMDASELRSSTLVIVGDGPEEARLRRLAAGRRVRFQGRRGPSEVARCMNAADVLALPSEYEGLPTAALEALACGCPVVAMKGTGLDNVIVPMVSGLLLGSIEEFPAALSEVLSAAPGMRGGCLAAAAPYSWDQVARDVRRVYDRVRGATAG